MKKITIEQLEWDINNHHLERIVFGQLTPADESIEKWRNVALIEWNGTQYRGEGKTAFEALIKALEIAKGK